MRAASGLFGGRFRIAPKRNARCCVLWLLGAVSCGWSERRFEIVGIAELCEAASTCAETYPAEICIDRLRSADRSSCTYDKRAAGDCIDALDEAECGPVEPFDLVQLDLPDACWAVYDCEWLDLNFEP